MLKVLTFVTYSFCCSWTCLLCGGQRRTVMCALVGLRNVIVRAVIFCHSYYLMLMVPAMDLLLIPLFRFVSEGINISSVIHMIELLYSAMIYSLDLYYRAGFGRILSFCGRAQKFECIHLTMCRRCLVNEHKAMKDFLSSVIA